MHFIAISLRLCLKQRFGQLFPLLVFLPENIRKRGKKRKQSSELVIPKGTASHSKRLQLCLSGHAVLLETAGRSGDGAMLRTCPQTRCALLVLSELGVIFFLLKQKCSRAAVLHVPNDLQPSAKQRHRSACSAVLAHSTVQAAERKSSFSTTQCCLLSSSTSSTTSLPPHSLFGSLLLTYHKAKRHSLSWTSRLRTSPKELKLQAIFCKQSCLGSKPPHLWLSCSVALPTQKHAPHQHTKSVRPQLQAASSWVGSGNRWPSSNMLCRRQC